MIFGWAFPWALPKATLTMAVGQLWVGWRCVFPWALPKATLTMAVGQIVGWLAVCYSLGVAQGYVDDGRWPNCGSLAVWFFPGRCPRLH